MDSQDSALEPALWANLLQFGRLLRQLGLVITPEHWQTVLPAIALVGVEDRERFHALLRTILVSRREHLALFDHAFATFWTTAAWRPKAHVELGALLRRHAQRETQLAAASSGETEPNAPELASEVVAHTQWSARETLRHKDFADLSPDELRAVRQMLQEQALVLRPRRTRRLAASARGPKLDLRAVLRHSLDYGGEWFKLRWRRPREKPRPLVVLCDISGSMEPYSRLLLQFVFTLKTATERLEAFVFGTRLTRITREFAQRDIDSALKAATACVADWAGGTRIGESLRRFNFVWGRRVLAQGAVVLVISDGWDRGEPELLAREVARLKRSCSRLLWLNPLLGSPGYQPLTRGIVAILPYLDEFLPVHNLASLEMLRAVLASRGKVAARPVPARSPTALTRHRDTQMPFDTPEDLRYRG